MTDGQQEGPRLIQQSLEEKLQRHQAFWHREETDRPLLGFTTYRYSPREEYDLVAIPKGRHLTPEDFDVEAFLPVYDRQYRESREMAGDQIWTAIPFFGLSWLETIAGCPVRTDEDALWNEPIVADICEVGALRLSPDNPWLQKLLEFTTMLVAQSRGRYPVGIPFMSGPMDILLAMRGGSALLLDFYDHPDEVHAVLGRLADLWLDVASAQFSIIPEFHGGYGAGFREVWAPGLCPETQEDAMALLSPELFGEFLLPGLSRIISGFDFAPLHLHSGYLQHVDTVLAMDGLPAVEITVDVGGPPVAELLDVIAKAQRAKPTIVHGMLSMAEMRMLVDALPAEGLWLITRVASAQAANEMFAGLVRPGA